MKASNKLKAALLVGLPLLILVVIGVLINKGIIWFVYPDRDLYPLRGIDVSHHNGDIDWEKVAHSDVSFAFIKATEGDDFVDNKFYDNWSGAEKNGILFGAYHFYSLRIPGKLQAQNFIETVPVNDKALPPVIDLEFVGNSLTRPDVEAFQQQLREYIATIKKKYEKEPILYVTYEFYKNYLGTEFNSQPIWIRDIFKKPNTSLIPAWEFWQYKNRGNVNGINGYVDLNVFNGELEDIVSSTHPLETQTNK